MSEAELSQQTTQEQPKYLLFHIGPEIYGTHLLDVREVMEPLKAKPIPNTVSHFTGVINIRGEIVGVIDLRLKFGHPAKAAGSSALMVFNTAGGPVAAVVDKVESVVQIPDSDIEHDPNVQTNVPLEFLIGIGKHEERLVSLIDLNKILSSEEIRRIKAARRGA